MNCNDVRRYLSAYLDSELETSVNLEVNEHLEQCVPCAERFEQEAGLEGAIRDQLQATPSSPEFWNRIDAALEADDARRRGRWVPALAAAALLLIAATVWFVARPAGETGGSKGDVEEMGLIVALRERATDMQREGTTVMSGYRTMDAVDAKTFVERYLGAKSFLHAAPRPEHVAPHKLEVVGGGTTHVGGVETPVVHYRCCNKDLCVFFIVPASMRSFPIALKMLESRGNLTCQPSPGETVSIRRCPATGAVIGVAGSPCAPSVSTALVSR